MERVTQHMAPRWCNGSRCTLQMPHLVIAGTPSVQLAPNRADELCQPPLISRVDVLIP